ncbi:MAG: 2-hydroxychromene-2-carboxylate isomerase, partial [Pseudomonadota bacterium]
MTLTPLSTHLGSRKHELSRKRPHMAHIDYYLATISPNCYFAGTRPAEIAAKHGAT